jgi:hypothetical protein
MKIVLLASLLVFGIVSSNKGNDEMMLTEDSQGTSFNTNNLSANPFTWKYCASNGGLCTFPTSNVARIVVYGQGCENYFYRVSTGGSFACNSANFGGDPRPGFSKHCSYTNQNFLYYSSEGQYVCNPYPNSVVVAFGSTSYYNNYKYAPLSPYNCLPCTTAQFGVPGGAAPRRCFISRLPYSCP